MAWRRIAAWGVALATLGFGGALPGATPTVEQALRLTPVQKEVEYDVPAAGEVPQCTIAAVKIGTGSGWVVRDPTGGVLRRFIDTNGDNVVDQWCYYHHGIEVYRDIDANFNGKADQFRWLNTGGTRWGIDDNEDGHIDRWQVISAEEVSAEAARALATRDAARFQRLLLTAGELKSLGLGTERQTEVQQKLASAAAEFSDLARKQQVLGVDTRWLHFGALRPGVVPAGTDDLTRDLVVYENVLVLVESGGKSHQLRLGTMVQVGPTWRLIDAPQLLDDQGGAVALEAGYFFRTAARRPETPAAGLPASDAAFQRLLAELEAVDQELAKATAPAEQARLNARRCDVLEQLAAAAAEPADRNQWLQQLADMASAAAQSGSFPEGVERLRQMYERLSADAENKALAAYFRFRYLSADYGTSLQKPGADFEKIQKQWLENLQDFVRQYGDTPDAAEALLQLAIAEEFSGREDEAKQWYQQVVARFPNSAAARKSAGALTRLDCVGKPLVLTGQTPAGQPVDTSRLRGRVVLIHYWATWCEPCVKDLQTIKEMYAKYGQAGFLPVGVNLDTNKRQMEQFVQTQRINWAQLYEPGSLDGRLANELGILTLPTMLLIDKNGRVVNRNLHISELETELKKYLR